VAHLGGRHLAFVEDARQVRILALGAKAIEEVIAVPASREWHVLAAGDLDGGGESVLVVPGKKGLRVLGLARAVPARAPNEAPPLDDAATVALAPQILRRLGRSRQALEAVRRGEA